MLHDMAYSDWSSTWHLPSYQPGCFCPCLCGCPARVGVPGWHWHSSAATSTLSLHRWGFIPASPFVSPLHPLSSPGSVICPAARRWLAECGAIILLGAPSPGSWVPVLLAVLARDSPAQHLISLPSMPWHRRHHGCHQVGCGGNGDRISCHNAIRDVLFTAAQSAALAPSKETPGLVPSSLSRPADISLPNWCHGRPAALDVHVISPLQQLTLAEAAFTPGHALHVGTRRKLASNLSACRAAGAECIPLVAETLGGLSEDSILTIRAIGRAIGLRSSAPDPTITTKHLFGRVAIALWRGNASLWLHRHPTLPPSLDGVV